MGIFDFITKPVKELYIARPPEAAKTLIWMHPDRTVPRGARLKVRSDEVCVFFRNGRVCGTLEAGDYRLDSGNIPFLGELVVDPLTDGNHYLAELFFVRRAEYLQKSNVRELGSYHDLMSGHLVRLQYDIHFGVKVTDPVALITTLGGMEASSAQKVGEFLMGRVESHLRAAVGTLMGREPALRVVSNQYNEQIGQMVHELCEAQFKPQGLKLTRFVTLTISLDDESEASLREFGSARAGLAIQREGSQIANNPGFANFHIAQGQRSALEGLGEGMASGGNSAPILGVGIGLGGGPSLQGGGGGGLAPAGTPLLPTGGGTAGSVPVRAKGNRAPSTMRWYLKTAGGTEGPYTLRQLVLRSMAEGETVDSAVVRGEHDLDWFPASDEEAVRKEFERRQRNRKRLNRGDSGTVAKTKDMQVFESLFRVATEDQVVTRDELAMLAPLAVAAGLAEDLSSAERSIVRRARAYGCRVEMDAEDAEEATATGVTGSTSAAPPAPRSSPPPRPTLYAYDDGRETYHDLTAKQVAERVAQKPDGAHLVWTHGMSGWTTVSEVPEIQALLGEGQR